MSALNEHTLIYDDECPMCAIYSSAFVKTGMLDCNGRESFSSVASANRFPTVDMARARNEIALVDRRTLKVHYGLDSLVHIIGSSFPMVKSFTRMPLVHFFIARLYFFISYNRKVIAPGSVFEGRNACTPDLNYRYRIAYILLAWIVTSAILVSYSKLIPTVPRTDFYREFLVCGGQLIFQGAVLMFINRQRMIHYMGNVMTVSLGGVFALLPMLFVASVWPMHHIVTTAWFFVVVALMFFEHKRRVKILELPFLVSLTWLLYRFLVLIFIL